MSQIAERWDCHAHRDELRISDQCSIYHPDRGQLCYGEYHYDCYLYYPVFFKTKEAAQRWIVSGYISELQEGLSNLDVGFRSECFRWRE